MSSIAEKELKDFIVTLPIPEESRDTLLNLVLVTGDQCYSEGWEEGYTAGHDTVMDLMMGLGEEEYNDGFNDGYAAAEREEIE